jgi:hypothetical protein
MPAPPSQGVTPYSRKNNMKPNRLITSHRVAAEGIFQRDRIVEVICGRVFSTGFNLKSII